MPNFVIYFQEFASHVRFSICEAWTSISEVASLEWHGLCVAYHDLLGRIALRLMHFSIP